MFIPIDYQERGFNVFVAPDRENNPLGNEDVNLGKTI